MLLPEKGASGWEVIQRHCIWSSFLWSEKFCILLLSMEDKISSKEICQEEQGPFPAFDVQKIRMPKGYTLFCHHCSSTLCIFMSQTLYWMLLILKESRASMWVQRKNILILVLSIWKAFLYFNHRKRKDIDSNSNCSHERKKHTHTWHFGKNWHGSFHTSGLVYQFACLSKKKKKKYVMSWFFIFIFRWVIT